MSSDKQHLAPVITRRWFRARCIAAAIAMLLGAVARPAATFAADPQGDYAALFGEEEKKVMATATTKDDAAFAAKLLAKAAELKDAPELQRFMYARAMVLGQKDPDGLETAVEAAKKLVSLSNGADKLNWQSKLTDLYAQQYRKATGQKRVEAGEFLLSVLSEEADALAAQGKYTDAVKRLKEGQSIAQTIRSNKQEDLADRLKEIQTRQQTAEKFQKLRQRLDSKGGDVPLLEQVILGYWLELEDIQTALTLAAGHPDPAWQAMIAKAGRPLKELKEEDLLALADFYKKISDKGQPTSKRPALEKAHDLLTHFLKTHDRQDAARLKAQQELAEMDKVLDTLPGGPPSRVVIWNTYHAGQKSVGAAVLNVIAFKGGVAVWRQDNVPIEWVPGKDTFAAVNIPKPFDVLRVEVVRWNASGGGLSEIQVFRNKVNIAQGKPCTASGSYAPEFGPANLTDGITTSAVHAKGYWIGTVGKPNWAEVNLKGP